MDDIMVDQMYVQYMAPPHADRHVPVVMLHGCCLSGKTWETTPDGRMGWSEYFVRNGRAVYVPDQVGRARSGFDATTTNEARLGGVPEKQLPYIYTAGRGMGWKIFRFGPEYPKPFPDEQFPLSAVDEFQKQVIPDLNGTLPNPNPTLAALSALATRLHGAILMGHSESGFWPERAALLDPSEIRGLITIESGCTTNWSKQQLSAVAKIPILIVWGDHIDDVPSAPFWPPAVADCQKFADAMRAAGGDVTILSLPRAGLHGNSHMLMQDRNNLRVADLILRWIDQHVEQRQ